MTEAGVEAFLRDAGLWQGPVTIRSLKGGYQNEVLDVTTAGRRLVLKRFMPATTGTLFPNLPADEALALEILGRLDVSPRLLGFWPDQALMAYDYVAGSHWQTGAADVARLLLRKEAADPKGFRQVPLDPEGILAEGDALFARCKAGPGAARPLPVALVPPERLSLIHTDLGASNLIGTGEDLRIIDWQCPAAGDLAEDIYSFLSPAFHVLNLHPGLSPDEKAAFWAALNRPDLQARHAALRPYFAWRFAAYCLWRSETRPEPEVRERYVRAWKAELPQIEGRDAG
ncbi:MAG TPA: phosphotransferase [Tabrizicola sp.]|nr:phosphotransferase [Tabrizicola sp.]